MRDTRLSVREVAVREDSCSFHSKPIAFSHENMILY